MQISLDNQTAIVTGASRGIGRAIALTLGELGAAVVVNYASNVQAADEVVSQIIAKGGQAVAVRADMKDIAAVKTMFSHCIEQFGGLDILINNAGTAIYKPVEDFTEEEFDDIFDLNVKGLFFACQQAAKTMNKGGRIINISSTVTKLMLPTYGAYTATKGAVEQLTKVLAKELGPRMISVNAISPGPVDTELFRQGKSEEQINAMAGMAAFGRIGTPQDIADAVALMVSKQSGWVTGQNLYANGGFIG